MHQRLLEHILDIQFSPKIFLKSRYKRIQHTFLDRYHRKMHSTFNSHCMTLQTKISDFKVILNVLLFPFN